MSSGSAHRDFTSLAFSSFFFLLASSWVFQVQADLVFFTWNITYQFQSQDCYRTAVVAINGQTPGPIVDARQGDSIVIVVNNDLPTDSLVIHWHGIRQVRLTVSIHSLICCSAFIFNLINQAYNYYIQI